MRYILVGTVGIPTIVICFLSVDRTEFHRRGGAPLFLVILVREVDGKKVLFVFLIMKKRFLINMVTAEYTLLKKSAVNQITIESSELKVSLSWI